MAASYRARFDAYVCQAHAAESSNRNARLSPR